MKITVQEKKETTIDLQLPAYYKKGGVFYKILSEDTAIQVRDYEFAFSIGWDSSLSVTIPDAIANGQAITDDEFCAAFSRVGERVKRELVKAMESDAWKQQEQEKSIAEEMEAYEVGGRVEDSLNADR